MINVLELVTEVGVQSTDHNILDCHGFTKWWTFRQIIHKTYVGEKSKVWYRTAVHGHNRDFVSFQNTGQVSVSQSTSSLRNPRDVGSVTPKGQGPMLSTWCRSGQDRSPLRRHWRLRCVRGSSDTTNVDVSHQAPWLLLTHPVHEKHYTFHDVLLQMIIVNLRR